MGLTDILSCFFLPTTPPYLTAAEQLASVAIPDSQQSNVYALIRMEQRYEGKSKKRLHNLRSSYLQEEIDKAAYFIFIDGDLIMANNVRAVSRALISTIRDDQKQAVLVHRAGSVLDFNLAQKLLVSGYHCPELYVKRQAERCHSLGIEVDILPKEMLD